MLVNGERALAYIVTIDDITPINGADNIELARVGGWRVIVNKEQFKPGDAAVFFEIDSLVPEAEWSEFLRPKKFRVKTYKLNKFKVVSQGLLMPMDILPQDKTFNVGDDVTKVLGVTYYVKEDNYRKAKDGNPNEKYNRMAAKHPKLAKKKWFRWLMKRMWGKKLLFVFLGRHIDEKKYRFPAWIKRTDEDRCLIGDTKIQTEQGIFRIADIVNKKLDVNIKSYNFSTGKIEYKPIVSYQKYPNNEELLEIEYPYRPYTDKKNRVVCSKDHKFFVNGAYVKAEDIVVGDKILMPYMSYGDDAIAALYGMILGDACIEHDERCASKNIRIGVTHGEDQFDYMKIKQKMFGVDNFHILIGGKSGYCDKKIYRGQIITDPKITESVLNDCFINKKKTVTNSMVNKINEIGLALWYLDDGSLKHRDDNSGCNPNVIISTNAYTKEENEILINMLKNKFGIDCNIRSEKDKYWCIYITVGGTKKLFEIIGDYIPMSMKYKAPKEYENTPCVLEDIVFERKIRLIEIPVTNVKIYNGKRNYKNIYDIEVADNHNFFANNVLVHNCENTPWILDSDEPWVVTEKIDGTSTTVFLDCTKRKHDFGVCSRNVRQMTPDQENYHTSEDVGNVYWEMALKYDMQNALEDIAKKYNVQRVVLQGETYGEAIQGNPLHLKYRDFAAFNLIFDGERLGSIQAKEILDGYGIPFVPIIDKEFYMPDTFEELKEQADGKSTINPKCLREGFVYRSYDGKQSAKNVSVKYLLKQKD